MHRKDIIMKKITKCPYCGSSDGLYNDFNVSGRSFTNLMEKKMEKTLQAFIGITNIWFVSIVENAL